MGIFSAFFASQARKPSGFFGRVFMARIFEKGNTALNQFTCQILGVTGQEKILEIGFGTGYLIRALIPQMTSGIIHGVDFSDTMTAMARRRIRKDIDSGRVILWTADFDTAPFATAGYDLIFTVNTVYFWRSPGDTVAKIHELLAPGGRLVIGFHDRHDMTAKQLDPDIFALYSADDVKRLLSPLFSRVSIRSDTEGDVPCYCAVALK